MTNKTISKSQFVFEHYGKTPVKLEPHNSGYAKRLFKDHHHTTNINFNIPENVSNLIYGKI